MFIYFSLTTNNYSTVLSEFTFAVVVPHRYTSLNFTEEKQTNFRLITKVFIIHGSSFPERLNRANKPLVPRARIYKQAANENSLI